MKDQQKPAVAELVARMTFVYSTQNETVERVVAGHLDLEEDDVVSRRSREGYDYFVVEEVDVVVVDDDYGVPVSRVEQLILLTQIDEPGDESDPPENQTVTPIE